MKKTFLYRSVGNRLKLLRGELSQKDFSALIGTSLRTYQRYESGERLPPSNTVSRISKVCHAKLTWIITGRANNEEQFERDDFSQAVDKLDYLFQYGSDRFIDFINQLLDIALISARVNLETDFPSHSDPPHDLLTFLISLTEMSSTALQEVLISKSKSVKAQRRLSKTKKRKGHSKT